MSDEWEWRIGYLASLGPCAWQECGQSMKRITHVIMGPQGQIGLGKEVVCVMTGVLIPHLNMILFGMPASNGIVQDLERLWGSNLIQPINGASRLKLT